MLWTSCFSCLYSFKIIHAFLFVICTFYIVMATKLNDSQLRKKETKQQTSLVFVATCVCKMTYHYKMVPKLFRY